MYNDLYPKEVLDKMIKVATITTYKKDGTEFNIVIVLKEFADFVTALELDDVVLAQVSEMKESEYNELEDFEENSKDV